MRSWRLPSYVRKTLAYFPERLASPKWSGRCQISGLEELKLARAAGPVVIAFTHFGPYSLIGHWLRAAKFPVATLIGTRPGGREWLRVTADRNSLFPGQPTVLYRNMRQVNDFMAQGNALLVALDVASGKLVDVPVGDGTCFKMASGAARLALIHKAELFTCVITTVGPWRYRLNLAPVPKELLAGDAHLVRIGKAMLDQFLPYWRARPEQCPKMLLEAFTQKSNTGSVSRPDESIAA